MTVFRIFLRSVAFSSIYNSKFSHGLLIEDTSRQDNKWCGRMKTNKQKVLLSGQAKFRRFLVKEITMHLMH